MERVSSWVSYGTSVVMGLSVSELVGITLGVSTFLVNWYYQAKKDKRDEEVSRSKRIST